MTTKATMRAAKLRLRQQAAPAEQPERPNLLHIAALTMFCLYMFVAVMVALPVVMGGVR